jgi:hypothetical protein
VRLVSSSVRPGAAARSEARVVAAGSTCSKLSSRSSRRRLRRAISSFSTSGASPVSRTPSAAAMAFTTSSGSCTGARSTNTTPPGKRSATRSAASIARRLLPIPPGPVRVIRRLSSSRSIRATSRTSLSRPMSWVSGCGSDSQLGSGSSSAAASDGAGASARLWSNRSASSVARSDSMSPCSSRGVEKYLNDAVSSERTRSSSSVSRGSRLSAGSLM